MSDRAVTAAGRLHTENEQLRDRLATLERELAEAREQLSAAHDVRDVFARDLNRLVAECEKDEADRDAIVASLTDELRRAKSKAEQYQCDWMAAKAEFGDRLAALRQRHAEAVEQAYREGLREPSGDPDEYSLSDDELWLTSEAKARLT